MATGAGDEVLVQAVAVASTVALVVTVVFLHYEALAWIGRALKTRALHHRVKILVLALALIAVHVLEVGVFGAGYLVLGSIPAFGAIGPGRPPGFLDLMYFSATTYATVGYGDLVPTGALRLLCGMEALSGFILITWSASFMFLEMQRYWGRD